jgi:hypothetical protein
MVFGNFEIVRAWPRQSAGLSPPVGSSLSEQEKGTCFEEDRQGVV